jgi:hypothetical protein
MAKKRKPAGQESGGRRLGKYGKRPVLLGLRPAEHESIRAAAVAVGKPMTEFITSAALRAAEELGKWAPD